MPDAANQRERDVSDLESRASAFAIAAHERVDQKRKYTGEPYWHHPAAVAELVRSVPHTEEQIAAAWLHDTVEDTGVTTAEIERQFGTIVAQYVDALTDISRPDDGNRAARKAKDRQHSGGAPAAAKTVKLADLIDNSRSILARDPDFARVYIEEKRLLLPLLRDGDATLWAMANAIVEAAKCEGSGGAR